MKPASPLYPILVILPPIIATALGFGLATAAVLVVIHFAFRLGCVGDVAIDASVLSDASAAATRSMPYADSAAVFGFLTVHVSEYMSFSVIAKNMYAMGPILDSVFIAVAGFAALSGVWVASKGMTAVSFLYEALLPGIATIQVFFSPLSFQWKNGDSLLANVIRSVINTLFMVFFVELNLTAMVTMFIAGNMRYKLLADDDANVESLNSWLYGTIIAFGAPLFKFFNVYIQQNVFGIWKTPEVITTKEEEAKVHSAQIIYKMKDDVNWAVAANVLTLRSPIDSLFYISASESLALTLIQRIAMCLHFRWKRIREARRVGIVDAETTEVGEPAVLIADDKKHIETTVELLTAPVSVNETGLTSHIDITDAHTGNRGFAAEAFGAKKTTNNFAKTAATGLDALQQPEAPFIPLDPAVKYGHTTMSMMTSETAGRLCAYLIIIALVTLPDASSWSSWAGPLTTAQASVRLAFLLVGGTLVDAVAAAFEASWLGLDYRESVRHFTKEAGLSWNGFAFLFFSAVVTVVGYYIIADAGVVMEVAGYQRGRKF
ncbi:hypothetical protein HK101_010088 [Irineochytrium annulatum]|nr:hypothetical protein HK101_010088 [Irineochytrium annulatum]